MEYVDPQVLCQILQYAGVNILRNESYPFRQIQQLLKIKIAADNVPEKKIPCCFILSIKVRKNHQSYSSFLVHFQLQ